MSKYRNYTMMILKNTPDCEPCKKIEVSKKMMQLAKSATAKYNKAHSKWIFTHVIGCRSIRRTRTACINNGLELLAIPRPHVSYIITAYT